MRPPSPCSAVQRTHACIKLLSALPALALLLGAASARADVPPEPLPAPSPAPAPSPEPVQEPAPTPNPELSAPTEFSEHASEEPSAREQSAAYYTGFRWGISPGVAFRSGGSAAFVLSVYLGYGIDTGSVIFVPGVTIASIFSPNTFIYGSPELRIVYPIGIFAPFITGGAGPGITTSPASGAFVFRAGGGFTLHPSAKFAIGVEAGYMAYAGGVTGGGPYISPIISFAF